MTTSFRMQDGHQFERAGPARRDKRRGEDDADDHDQREAEHRRIGRRYTEQQRPALATLVRGRLDSEPVDAPWGARYFRLTDPDGFKLAVLKSLT